MLTGAYQTTAILAVVLLYYGLDSLLLGYYDRLREDKGSGRNWGFTARSAALIAIMAAQPMVAPVLGVVIAAPWGLAIQILGALLIADAFALLIWCRVHLRHFYTERVELQAGHGLVESGPYAYVRHPIFTAFFMIVVGLVLINPAATTLFVAMYAFWDFGGAARREEELLSQNVPGYKEYMQRTNRFLPSLKSRK